MILKKDIQNIAEKWGVLPDIVDKDYILGHFLVALNQHFGEELIFKGGTCLRKCYFPDYRFSEDLDFTAYSNDFVLKASDLEAICNNVEKHTGILLYAEEIAQLLHQNKKMGYQVKIKYWGANHSKNQQPLPPERWVTKIKLEISTEEICLLPADYREVNHPYPDSLLIPKLIPCYSLQEIIAEKLRSLVQRSYTAPRDYYDLYQLTLDMTKKEWKDIRPIFLKKMEHKGIIYTGPEQLVNEKSIVQIRKAWDASIAHQINIATDISANSIIDEVIKKIKKYLDNF